MRRFHRFEVRVSLPGEEIQVERRTVEVTDSDAETAAADLATKLSRERHPETYVVRRDLLPLTGGYLVSVVRED